MRRHAPSATALPSAGSRPPAVKGECASGQPLMRFHTAVAHPTMRHQPVTHHRLHAVTHIVMHRRAMVLHSMNHQAIWPQSTSRRTMRRQAMRSRNSSGRRGVSVRPRSLQTTVGEHRPLQIRRGPYPHYHHHRSPRGRLPSLQAGHIPLTSSPQPKSRLRLVSSLQKSGLQS